MRKIKISVDIDESCTAELPFRRGEDVLIQVSLCAQGMEYEAEGAEIRLNAMLPDGTVYVQQEGISAKGNLISAMLDKRTVGMSGDVGLEFLIYHLSGRIAGFVLCGVVEAADENIESTECREEQAAANAVEDSDEALGHGAA